MKLLPRLAARAATLACVLAAALAAAPAGPTTATAAEPDPFDGIELFVDRDAPAWHAWQQLRRAGKTRQANLVWRIAREPSSRWVGRFTKPSLERKLGPYLDQAEREGKVAVLMVLRAQSVECHPRYLAGGVAEDRRTRRWYADLARVIGSQRVIVLYELDSLGTVDCLARHRRDDRYRVLRYGVRKLTSLPNTTLYIEAGASDWEPARSMARKLRRVGVGMARGFMLNATHYDWTRNNIRYGLDLSRRVGGKHFVINTAQNGRGPIHYREGRRRVVVWCNPGLRGLGLPPSADTAHPRVDAYLWINRPGYVQSCSHGAIEWNLRKALTLARFQTDWVAAPKGTRHGHRKRRPARAFNIPR